MGTILRGGTRLLVSTLTNGEGARSLEITPPRLHVSVMHQAKAGLMMASGALR